MINLKNAAERTLTLVPLFSPCFLPISVDLVALKLAWPAGQLLLGLFSNGKASC